MSGLQFNLHAIPPALTALLVSVLGIATLVRERGSRASLPFAWLAASLTVWQFGLAMLYSSASPGALHVWVHAGTLGVTMVPAAALNFCLALGGARRQYRRVLWLVVAGSLLFLLTSLYSDQHIAGVQALWWGPYPRYGWAGYLFIGFLALVLTGCLAMLWRTWRNALPGSVVAGRTRVLLLGTGIGCLSAVDLLPALGIAVYPLGCVPVLIMFIAMLWCTRSYHLFDVTPSLAGPGIIDTMSDAVLAVDDARTVRMANPAAAGLFELAVSELIGSDIAETLDLEECEHLVNRALGGATVQDEEVLHTSPRGAVRVLEISASPLRSPGGRIVAAILMMTDATEQRRAADKIRFLAFNDPLTLLPNRAHFESELASAVRDATDSGDGVALFFMDLDHFKRINDTLGHEAGDQLLRAVARRLVGSVRVHGRPGPDGSGACSLSARLGGDEFAVLMRGVCDPDHVNRIARRLLALFTEPFAIGNHEVFASASLGVSMTGDGQVTPESLLKRADIAMYCAKETGRNAYRVFESGMETLTVESLLLEADLRRALELGQFEVFLQPQVDYLAGEVVGAEALLRWRHPDLGLVPPGRFMPLAEDTGLIIAIGRWVLEQACREAAAWPDTARPLKVSVNLSERQFRDNDLTRDVADALKASGLAPARLELELTESIIMRDGSDSVQQLNALKRLGTRISVDDFGTGYSSLSYLKRFPIDVIKIDRSFVTGIADDGEDRAITGAILALARALHREVIAEGVETASQAHRLREMGCSLMQGYLFGRPMHCSEFAQHLDSIRQRPAQPGTRPVMRLAGGPAV